ncbi:MAG: ArsC/Spx/MgsR family protein [Floccifex sp.]
MNKILFIGYPRCSTCIKAYKALCEKYEVSYRDISKDNPSKEEIMDWINKGISLNQLWNTSGKLYREFNIKEKKLTHTQEELVSLLAQHGMLVKRPVVIYNEQIYIGNQYQELLK